MEYLELDSLIEALEKAVEETHPQRGYWREIWGLVRQIGSGFKGIRYPSRDAQKNAWQRFQELVARVKARSENTKIFVEEKKRQWERRQYESTQARETVEGRAMSARPLSGLDRILLLPGKLIATIMLKMVGLEAPSQLDEIRDELQSCNLAMKEAWTVFNQQKTKLLPGDRKRALDCLYSARAQLNEAWSQWKEQKSAVHKKRQREWEERQVEKERRYQSFVERRKTNIEKLEAKLTKAEQALERQEIHLSELRDKHETAWNDSFKDRCSGWIDETENRIESIKEHVYRLKGWLREEHDKLR